VYALNDPYSKSTVARDFTKDLLIEITRLKSMFTMLTDTKDVSDKTGELREKQFAEMRQKLATIVIDMLKNLRFIRDMFSIYQQRDDYLSVIYRAVQKGDKLFHRYFIEDSVLYIKSYDKHFNMHRYLLCVPDECMPPILHFLHTLLGHSSMTAVLKSFQAFYFHRKEFWFIKKHVRSCTASTGVEKSNFLKEKEFCSENLFGKKSCDTVSLLDSEKGLNKKPPDTVEKEFCSENFFGKKSCDTVSLLDPDKELDKKPPDTVEKRDKEHFNMQTQNSKELEKKNLFKKGVRLFMTRN
jgi:hypothetical protein